jgi:hypothetical protein
VLAGLIVVEGPGGSILHFPRVGYVVACASLVTLFMVNRIRRMVPEGKPVALDRLASPPKIETVSEP